MSGNDIALVENESFKSMKAIINLSLSRNSIAQIDIFAFIDLEKISILDLSDNRLEQSSFDNCMLERNEQLTFLDLSRNNFMTTFDAPLLKSNSLNVLALRNSHLSHIYDSFFSELPNLLSLDMSENLLITLSSSAVRPLRELHFINLEYNRFFCELIEETLKLFKSMKMIIKIDKCGKASKKPMFEKMIMQSSPVTPSVDIDIDLVWGEFNNVTANNKSNERPESMLEYYTRLKNDNDYENCEQEEFELFCDCKDKFLKLYEMKNMTNQMLVRQSENRIHAVFYVGLFLGALFGFCMLFSIQFFIAKCQNLKKQQDLRQRAREQFSNENIREETLPLRPIPPPRASEIIQSNNLRPSSRTPRPTQRINNNNNRSNNSMSSTAHLIHKLFRNRESRQPLVVEEAASSSTSSNNLRVVESDNQVENEANDNDEILLPNSSERSVTPPPPYISIFN